MSVPSGSRPTRSGGGLPTGLPAERQPATGVRDPGASEKLARFRDAALAQGIPEGDVERWLGLARPSLVLSSDGEGPVVGHFGTPVTLPPDVTFPVYGDDPDVGHHEHLVATLDLAALPEGATNLSLPSDGHLLLFAWPAREMSEYHGSSCAYAVYVPAGAEVGERVWHHDYEPDHELGDVDFDGELRGEIRLEYDVSLPDYENFEGDPLLKDHPHAGELGEVWSNIHSEGYWRKGPQLQLGGYALDAQGWGDPVAQCAFDDGGDAARRGDWTLLAQWHPGMYGLEGITVYWAIPEEDLVAHRFSPARGVMYAD
ncbi:DUF1963 domain-containing protein [Streptomyces sp. NPDC127039]|uniref:DUF1963 domain-containing protein n=1 Tax=Streptomyces sp. NPDC127039 TaxID=3347115 RepID=UPI003662E038